jgi:hypothetical protein
MSLPIKLNVSVTQLLVGSHCCAGCVFQAKHLFQQCASTTVVVLPCRLRYSELAILAQYAPEDATLQQLAASADAFNAWAAELQVREETLLLSESTHRQRGPRLAAGSLHLPAELASAWLCPAALQKARLDALFVTAAACRCCPSTRHEHHVCLHTLPLLHTLLLLHTASLAGPV